MAKAPISRAHACPPALDFTLNSTLKSSALNGT
eukprot:CAMPEP_0169190218 /NCGR_PEP_ID=MMETSP1016-20121227/4417_1 /TAXON_ID=342587 /ORGANISM="Karlodinium micrum, Strain CCMP2283" /LENGTH=32 /DNA_ID= /DNA_START= /DNA_END= /DNA_ORIENTATION=